MDFLISSGRGRLQTDIYVVYLKLKNLYRPSHADYTYEVKYGFRDWRGSGRASARETLARVAAGAVAKKFLKEKLNIKFISFVEQVGLIKTDIDLSKVKPQDIEAKAWLCFYYRVCLESSSGTPSS